MVDIVWSKDEDNWDYSLEDIWEVFQEIEDNYDEGLQAGQIIYYGEKISPSKIFVDANDVIEMIGNQAADNGGEWAYDYPDVPDEQKKQLQDFLVQWQKQFTPNWYEVKNVKEYTITHADVDGFSNQ